MRRLALVLLLIVACAEADQPVSELAERQPAPGDDVRALIAAGQYAEALQDLDALESEQADDGAVDPAIAQELTVLRAWAEAGLGDCRLAAELAQTPLPGMSEGDHARLIGRASDLAAIGLFKHYDWTWRPDDVAGWNEKVTAATCVLDAALVRFPDDASRIEAKREQIADMAWTPEDAAAAEARMEELKALMSGGLGCHTGSNP